ncbi:MAG: hypothetical protein K2Y23_06235 [Cyanobacteria bacterium]|nr:hypothetical protein [Cyanobacteriota bacterium]
MIVVDAHAQPLRVTCDFCGSEHNFRGGPRNAPPITRATEGSEGSDFKRPVHQVPSRPVTSPPPQTAMAPIDNELEATIRRIIREETGLTPVAPAEKWRGGQLVLRPGRPGVQEKAMPIDSFFNKVVMLRNRLRTLEQQVNASEMPDDQKLKLQGYITACYGSLTSFNVLFANDDDKFVGSGGGD